MALAQGHHTLAQHHLKQALTSWTPVAYSRYERAILTNCLVCALRSLGLPHEAREQLATGLQDARQNRSYRGLLVAVTAGALLELDRGNAAQGLRLYATAANHPLVSHSTWYADIAGKEMKAATSQLPQKVATEAHRIGQTVDLWSVGQTLLESIFD